MTRIKALLLAAALALAGCTTHPPHPEAFAFGILGDTPYSANETAHFLEMIHDINVEPLAFVVHVGDMKAGSNSPCTDALYEERRAQFERFKAPFHFVPGDNDWVDCRRPTNGSMDPLERLEKLRSVYYGTGGPFAPTAKRIEGDRQPGYPENLRWTRSGVVFVTVNVQGSNDNVGFGAAGDAEQEKRRHANLDWISRAIRDVRYEPGLRGLAVIFHANPWEASRQDVYKPYLIMLHNGAVGLGKPVLFIHGDTHHQRVDHPFKDPNGDTVRNLTRMETFGSPWVGWVKVYVDPDDPDLFSFEPRLR